MPEKPEITVGTGPVTQTGLVFTIGSLLLSVSTGITTLTGSLPAGVPERYGVALTATAGAISALGYAILVAGRTYFAKIKAAQPDAQPSAAGFETSFQAASARLDELEARMAALEGRRPVEASALVDGLRAAISDVRELAARQDVHVPPSTPPEPAEISPAPATE